MHTMAFGQIIPTSIMSINKYSVFLFFSIDFDSQDISDQLNSFVASLALYE